MHAHAEVGNLTDPDPAEPCRYRMPGANELEQLAAKAATGDQRATDQLMMLVHPRLVRYCRGRIGRDTDRFSSADDIAQEACLAILAALPHYHRTGAEFLPFAYRVTANKIVDLHRRNKIDRSRPFAELPEPPDREADPEHRFLRTEQSEQLGQLLRRLPDRQREILLLRLAVGLSTEETARAIGTSPGAVRVIQHRALAKLRAVLAPAGRTTVG